MHGNNYFQLIGLLIVVGFSVISWIFRQIQEQKAKKDVRDRQEQRELEILRTGRDPATRGVPSAESQRQRELAMRREAQLAELRRRAQSRAVGTSPEPVRMAPRQTPIPPIRTIPGSMGPTVPQRAAPRPAPLAKPQNRPRPGPAQRPQPSKKPPVQSKMKPAVMPELPPVEQPPAAQPSSERSGTSPLVHVGAPRTPEEWRRAIIANEIMMPPLATRSGDAPVPF